MSSLKAMEVTYQSIREIITASWKDQLHKNTSKYSFSFKVNFCTPPSQIVHRNFKKVNLRKYSSHTFELGEQQLKEKLLQLPKSSFSCSKQEPASVSCKDGLASRAANQCQLRKTSAKTSEACHSICVSKLVLLTCSQLIFSPAEYQEQHFTMRPSWCSLKREKCWEMLSDASSHCAPLTVPAFPTISGMDSSTLCICSCMNWYVRLYYA